MNPAPYLEAGLLAGVRVHWHHGKLLRASRGYSILESWDGGQSFVTKWTLPAPRSRQVLSRFEPTRTLLRVGIRTYLHVSTEEALVFADGHIYYCGDGVREVGRMRAGRAPFPQGCCMDSYGRAYFGEYWKNPGRSEVRVYRGQPREGDWEPAVVFPAGAVRHVHAVQLDPFTDRVWIATGDDDSECRIGYLEPRDSAPRLHTIFEGSQMARAVSLLFTRDYVYWGSDSTFTTNWIVRWSRSTGSIERVAEIGGPAYFSTQNARGHLFISTCVEGSSPEPDRFARIWMSDDGEEWREMERFEKDSLPYIVTYGRICFAQGAPQDSEVYAFAEGVKGSAGTRVYRPAGIEASAAARGS